MSRKTFSFVLSALALLLLIVSVIFLTLDCGKLTVSVGGNVMEKGTISGFEAIFGDSKDQYKFNAINFTTFMVTLVTIVLLAVRLVLKFLNKNEKAIKVLGIVCGVLAIVSGVMLILIPQFADKTSEFQSKLDLAKQYYHAEINETIKFGIILSGVISICAGIFEFVDTFALKLFYGKKNQEVLD